MGQWKKGRSGNPKGRPRGQSLREELRRLLSECDPKKPERTRYADWAHQILAEVERGDRDRLDVIRFLEGPHPPDVIDEPDEGTKPRIVIPR